MEDGIGVRPLSLNTWNQRQRKAGWHTWRCQVAELPSDSIAKAMPGTLGGLPRGLPHPGGQGPEGGQPPVHE